ncbi:hypothetical protein LPB140_01650 [Sphingorhabdus lutea]|uniref:DNA repair protein MmcB-related protein n=1 Tax=Sphingorhabdus lutea TaxID=1913578 RepID=A0A1L3JEB2_9SPHN|nr:MmcB family DNA repair protein [Sphingorhabdus lutea]APG63464.1 hypothetical protein LPB140_01650 [Sphingorhabdus lutea]
MTKNEEISAVSVPPIMDAALIARGASRLFYRNGVAVQTEISLPNGRRTDLMGLNEKGEIIIVEIKSSLADLRGDQKWTEYLEHCDRFYWAVPVHLAAEISGNKHYIMGRCGLIVADQYDAEIVHPAKLVPLSAARRKADTKMLAHISMRRMMQLLDPKLTI